jgi:hypothetical protein
MKAIVAKTVLIALEMSESEAIWLKNFLRDPKKDNSHEFVGTVKDTRSVMFTAIKDALIVASRQGDQEETVPYPSSNASTESQDSIGVGYFNEQERS